MFRKWGDDKDVVTKQKVMSTWAHTEEQESSDFKLHLISRKWLVHFLWGEEVGPIDNSDVVCPHGFIVPYETVHLGATWIPHPVWEVLEKE